MSHSRSSSRVFVDAKRLKELKALSVAQIWEQLEAVGLSSTEACGDTPRVMLGCPLEGVARDSVLDAGPALRATVEAHLGDPAFFTQDPAASGDVRALGSPWPPLRGYCKAWARAAISRPGTAVRLGDSHPAINR